MNSPMRLNLRALSLRQMLTIPYVALVLLACLAIGGLSYVTGRDAVNTLSDYLLKETVGRISQAVERHLSGSGAVLETAFPTGVPAPYVLASELDSLRTRFWLATSMHRDPHNYVYYGDRSGHFLGLWRFSETDAELRVRTQDTGPRRLSAFAGISGTLGQSRLEERVFDPRERPWFKAGQSSSQQTWTSIYIDFKTLDLVATRARRVNNAVDEFQGVVATDLPLQHLNTFLKQLKLSPNGFAFIVEADGNLIATSRGPNLIKAANGANQRLNAAAAEDVLIASTYREVRTLMAKTDAATVARTAVFDAPDGSPVQVGYARVHDDAGLDWVIAVAVPRSDFLSGITTNMKRTALLALLVALLIVSTGFIVLAAVSGDLKQLTRLARDVGDGVLGSEVNMLRNDELGDLARSFSTMQKKLLTDRLTGLSNREAFIRLVEEKIIQRRRSKDSRVFAVFFIDLSHFKAVNDTHGHDVGDKVLVEAGQRMQRALRATDVVARFGGDEFVVLLDAIEHRDAAQAVRKTLEAELQKPLQVSTPQGEVQAVTGADIGLAMCPDDGQDVDTLLKCADEDMYARKGQRKASGQAPVQSGP